MINPMLFAFAVAVPFGVGIPWLLMEWAFHWSEGPIEGI